MTSVAKTSSSSSLLSDSLHSSSFDSRFPGDLQSSLHFEDQIELPSLVDAYANEDMEEATLVLPSSQWAQPATVAIVLPGDNTISVTEVQGEVQRLEDEMSQESQEMKKSESIVAVLNDSKHSLYLDSKTTRELHCTPRTAEAFLPFMPADYLASETLTIAKNQEGFQDWQSDFQINKRSREELDKSKGKGKRMVDFSSDGVVAEVVDGWCEPISNMTNRTRDVWMSGHSSHSFRDAIQPNEEDHGACKRKIIVRKSSKASNRRPADSGWQSPTPQWRKLVRLDIPDDPTKRTRWPPWLHPALQIENKGFIPRISHLDLQLLFQGVSNGPIKMQSYKNLFYNILGPIACWDRDEEILETVEAIGKTISDPRLIRLHEYIDCDEEKRKELPNSFLFIERFLGNFPTFASFLRCDKEYNRTLSELQYQILSHQMVQWYGTADVDDYVLWATSRLAVLSQDRRRIMSPNDLSSKELREWQERLDACGTIEEAETVTEEIFGPLQKIDYYEQPRVDLNTVWSPCQCNICNRSRKRVKLN